MNETLKNAILKLVEESLTAGRSDDAMKYAQAALNLAHALVTVDTINR